MNEWTRSRSLCLFSGAKAWMIWTSWMGIFVADMKRRIVTATGIQPLENELNLGRWMVSVWKVSSQCDGAMFGNRSMINLGSLPDWNLVREKSSGGSGACVFCGTDRWPKNRREKERIDFDSLRFSKPSECPLSKYSGRVGSDQQRGSRAHGLTRSH